MALTDNAKPPRLAARTLQAHEAACHSVAVAGVWQAFVDCLRTDAALFGGPHAN